MRSVVVVAVVAVAIRTDVLVAGTKLVLRFANADADG